MEHIFEYAILKAIPDARRGERVNVGIVVLNANHFDVRFSGLAKVRALAGGDWTGYADRVKRRLEEVFSSVAGAAEFATCWRLQENVIRISEIAAFAAASAELYELRIAEILSSLVVPPRLERRPRNTRINTEIAAEFKRANALAMGDMPKINDKIQRDFPIAPEEELRADFALQNGVLHATATLDLRRVNIGISRAALPALVLDKAAKTFGSDTKRYGVYAAAQSAISQFAPHIRILKDYSDYVFNWDDAQEKRKYTQLMYLAMNRPESYRLT
jgi:Protein of unknown function (DUF3037)